ncbi:MAG: DNA-3-methyladenine glycosylase 2 family protein [Chitinophagaceae bacterium]|nr:DNA-3-methyladenine glycosylase 2 family protein [Chitinophagaceae bacterium]
MSPFSAANFHSLCRKLARKDAHLQSILDTYGYPPMWSRPNTFQTLVLTILEQQVSLAAAYAAYKKLKEKTGRVTPGKILALTDEELRACYFSRQKIGYVKGLAREIDSGALSLRKLATQDETSIRERLKSLKGIGDWTVDIYLIHVLQRPDIFPLGDIALVNSIKHVKALAPHTTKTELEDISQAWKPYRTIATMLFWHHYINRKGLRIEG